MYKSLGLNLGPLGFPSRVLASRTNSFLTYVSPEEVIENTKSIGHIDHVTLNELYHFKSINEDYLNYFNNSIIDKVVINKKTNRFHFVFNIDNI